MHRSPRICHEKSATIADERLLIFVTEALNDDAPRVKWESAKVIGNIAKYFPEDIDHTIEPLLQNAEHSGTVMRWATAYALAEILKIKSKSHSKLLAEVERLAENEENNDVKKKYLDALRRVKK